MNQPKTKCCKKCKNPHSDLVENCIELGKCSCHKPETQPTPKWEEEWINKFWDNETHTKEEELDFIRSLLAQQSHDNEILINTTLETKNAELAQQKKKLIEMVEGMRIPERLEEIDGEERELLIKIFGEAKTPEYLVERRYGYNQALSDVIDKLNNK